MRLWTLHPMYLDSKGLSGCWREALLARSVLRKYLDGIKCGYQNHSETLRFKETDDPIFHINRFIYQIYIESRCRKYSYDTSKIEISILDYANRSDKILVKEEQVLFEWRHLNEKLAERNKEQMELNKLKLFNSGKIFLNQTFELV